MSRERRARGGRRGGRRHRTVAVILGRADAHGMRPVERAEIRPRADAWGRLGLGLAHTVADAEGLRWCTTQGGARFEFTAATVYRQIDGNGRVLELTRDTWCDEALRVFDALDSEAANRWSAA